MRSFVFVSLMLLGTSALSHAQTNATAPAKPAERENWMISFLTPDQQVEYAKAHEKALADNPALETEGNELKDKGAVVLDKGTAAEKQAFMEKMTAHRQKLRAAMLKVDPNLGPIFSEIDKRLSQAKAKGTEPAAPATH